MGKMSKLSKEQYAALISSCADNCTSSYCFLKAFLESNHPSERTVVQLKCVEILKWNLGEKINKDIGFQETCEIWVREGWAEAFALVFDIEKTTKENFEATEKQKILKDVENASSTKS